MSRQFLLCSDADHAASVDAIVMDHLRETEGARGSAWSGVYTDGDRYAILWGQPVAAVFGEPADDAAMVLAPDAVDASGKASIWSIYVPPAPDPIL